MCIRDRPASYAVGVVLALRRRIRSRTVRVVLRLGQRSTVVRVHWESGTKAYALLVPEHIRSTIGATYPNPPPAP
eukprot:2849412-Rhodomonas_salina.1